MLRAGVSATRIARELGVPLKRVHQVRDELGLPRCAPGPPALSLREAFLARSRPVAGGHREWVGHTNHGKPSMQLQKRRYSACCAAFVLHTGRWPVGVPAPECGVSWCVEPSHQGDAQSRADLDALCLAVFGEVP